MIVKTLLRWCIRRYCRFIMTGKHSSFLKRNQIVIFIDVKTTECEACRHTIIVRLLNEIQILSCSITSIKSWSIKLIILTKFRSLELVGIRHGRLCHIHLHSNKIHPSITINSAHDINCHNVKFFCKVYLNHNWTILRLIWESWALSLIRIAGSRIELEIEDCVFTLSTFYCCPKSVNSHRHLRSFYHKRKCRSW